MFRDAFRSRDYSERGTLRMSIFLWSVVIILFVAGWVNGARAHDGYDHFKNPVTGVSCCSNFDCRPMTADEVELRVREVPEGVLVDGKLFPKEQLQEGPDGRWHICEHPVSKFLFCILTPRPSF